jgi:hypothetical protein
VKTAERQLYIRASDLARVAMGMTEARRGQPAEWKACDDPLAWWCLVEAIVAFANIGPHRKSK